MPVGFGPCILSPSAVSPQLGLKLVSVLHEGCGRRARASGEPRGGAAGPPAPGWAAAAGARPELSPRPRSSGDSDAGRGRPPRYVPAKPRAPTWRRWDSPRPPRAGRAGGLGCPRAPLWPRRQGGQESASQPRVPPPPCCPSPDAARSPAAPLSQLWAPSVRGRGVRGRAPGVWRALEPPSGVAGSGAPRERLAGLPWSLTAAPQL